jgi:EmrB/QacA subfamily drug resistance transporter
MSPIARVTAIVSTGVFLASLDLFIVNLAFPDIQEDFAGTTRASLSWVLSAYAIVFAALLVPAGRWADRVGRKRVFLTGLGLFAVASGAAAAAWTVETLVAARVLQAAGAAMLVPASLGLLLATYPPERHKVAIGIWSAVAGVAASAGPVVGGLLVELGWQWVFILNLPITAVAFAAGMRVLPEVRDPSRVKPDTAGAVVLAGAVAALVAAIVQGPEWGWDSAGVLALFAAAVVLGAVVVARAQTHPAPVVEPALVRERRFLLANVAMLLFFLAFSAMLLGSVLYLTEVWGRTTLEAGLMLAPGPLAAAISAVPGALLGAKLGFRRVGLAGVALYVAGGAWWMTQMGAQSNFAGELLPAMIIGGLGVGLVNPTLVGAASAALPPERFATGTGVLNMNRQVGTALGVALLVALVGTPAAPEAVDTFRDAWWIVVGSAASAGVALALIGAPTPRLAPTPAPKEALS